MASQLTMSFKYPQIEGNSVTYIFELEKLCWMSSRFVLCKASCDGICHDCFCRASAVVGLRWEHSVVGVTGKWIWGK